MADPFQPVPPRFDAALIGGDLSRGEAAVAAAGGRVVARLRWGEALVGLDGRPVIVVEAEGADEATLADALPAIAAAAEAFRCAVVAAFDAVAIDVVAANLWGPRVELLCQPTMPERVEALNRAASEPSTQGVREDDHSAGAGAVGEAARRFAAEPPRERNLVDAGDLRRVIRARRMRDGFFIAGLFADPAWDMLLDLYAAELETVPVSVSSLCIAAAVAPTTALRWIARMGEDGLLDRRPDAADRRRAFVTLTEIARAGMAGYLVGLKRAGLALV